MTRIPDFDAHIRKRVAENRSVTEAMLASGLVVLVAQVAEWVIETYQKRGKVLLFGNGGSAADAQHIAAELGGKYYLQRPPLAALALHTNTSLITAIGNDLSYDRIFSLQVQALAGPLDAVIGISTSGTSGNVIAGIRTAKAQGARTIALTGASGGILKDLTDCCICVPSSDTPRIQEAHIIIGHIICELVENRLFSDS
jgi:D-sedoheptulose 7-phosphate isomerase